MSEQFSLFGNASPAHALADTPSWRYGTSPLNVFFAITPDAETADSIFASCRRLAVTFELAGTARQAQVLHVSLHGVDGGGRVSTQTIDAAKRIGDSICFPSFDIESNRVMAFGGQKDRKAIVLCGGDNAELKAFRQQLGIALANASFPVDPRFTPHMTFMYGHEFSGAHVIAPMVWRATEFHLILSHVGEKRYERLGSWALQDHAT